MQTTANYNSTKSESLQLKNPAPPRYTNLITCNDVDQLIEEFLRELHTHIAEVKARVTDRLPETDWLQFVTHNGGPSEHAPDHNHQQE